MGEVGNGRTSLVESRKTLSMRVDTKYKGNQACNIRGQEIIADKEITSDKHCIKDKGSKFWVVIDNKQTQKQSESSYSH